MSGGSLPPIESVSGGSHGVQAGYEQMLALSGLYDRQAFEFTMMAGLGARIMANGDLLESAVLSPGTFADAEVQLLDATTGVDGLTIRAVGIEADAITVRTVISAFILSDALAQHAMETLDNALGQLLFAGMASALPALVVAGGLGAPIYAHLSQAEREALQEKIAEDLGQALHDHPGLAQHLINGGGGLLQNLVPGIGLLNLGDGPIDRATTNDAAKLLALLLGNDTDYDVTRLDGIEPTKDQAKAPDSLADLMNSLYDTNKIDHADQDKHGAIQIQQVGEKYIVYIPGTDDLSAIPKDDEHARDMLTNYQLIGGMDSAYGRGIQQAMLDAGLEGKDVMLVGHSQGGMVSTSLAADPDFTQHFNVQHVVTAGSPTAQVESLPAGTSAIHFENRGDVVPLLDGEDNPDQPNRVTVKFDMGGSHVGENHGIDRYVEGARAADASNSGSIQDQITQMEQDGYLGAATVGELETFQITRR